MNYDDLYRYIAIGAWSLCVILVLSIAGVL
jgi:hypothetical protein